MKKQLTILLLVFSIFSFSQDDTTINLEQNLIDNPVDTVKSKYFKFDTSNFNSSMKRMIQ